MTSAATLVIDVGKTNVKLCCVDEAGSIREQRSRPNHVEATGPYPHFDLDAVYGWIVETLADFPDRSSIGSIATTTHGASAVLVAGESLALPMLDYEFDGVAEIDAEYDALARDFAATASPGLPAGLNLGRQLYWQRKRFPQEFAAVTDILLYPQYWAWRLTGGKGAEVTSLGCHTDLWAAREGDFSSFARAQGFDRLFPRRVNAWDAVGSLHPELARRTGLTPECRVLAGIHDSNASFFTHRATRREAFSVVSTGTWVVCMASGAPFERLDEERDMLANVDAFGDPIPCSRFMGGREYHAIAGDDGLEHRVTAEDLVRVIGNGTLAVPCFARAGGPFRGSDGRIVGPEPSGVADRAALATLYTALMTHHCLERLGARGDAIVEGSFVKNPAYAAVLAALNPERAVYVSDDTTGTVRGTAALARWPSEAPTGVRLERAPAWSLPGLSQYRTRWSALVDAL